MANKGLGDLMTPHTGLLKHREWRGFRDTFYDYFKWLTLWKNMTVMVLKAPVKTVKALFRYRWFASYLAAPAFVDRHMMGQRGYQLRISHLHFGTFIHHVTTVIHDTVKADRRFDPDNKLADKIILMDEMVPREIMAGFPNLNGILTQVLPIFLTSMVDQHSTEHYLDSIESYGVPADVCPLPSGEAGVAVEDDYPKIGKALISCNMPCDGSVMTTSFQDRRMKLPSFLFNVPLQYDEEASQEYAVEEVEELIRFIEEQTGEKFDWDAFFRAMENYNKETEYEMEKWDVNKTPYPQLTGANFWLYRLYYFHWSGGFSPTFLKTDQKVNKLMMKAYAEKNPVSKVMRHRAIVWSCPANYYTNFANWMENCWGINVVMDMETMISYQMFHTNDREEAKKDLAMTYQRATMRKHTKGGYRHVVDELWRIVEEFNADMVIMYDQISCKGMDGLNGIFDDQAREHNVSFIWVKQDLMDPRTVSRRDMREQVNRYMTAVLREEPVDPSLVDFEDDLAW